MSTSTLHLGIFYMPQIYDMGPTALLPLRRKVCWGFFFALKNPTTAAGFEPANLGSKGRHATPRPPKPLRRHTELINLMGNLCCAREHSVQFFTQLNCTVYLIVCGTLQGVWGPLRTKCTCTDIVTLCRTFIRKFFGVSLITGFQQKKSWKTVETNCSPDVFSTVTLRY